MKGKAYAKINISLDVIGKRNDGYHLLSMIMQNIELYDEIEVKQIKEGIIITCNKSFIPTDERNLAYKAAKLFLDTYNIKSGVSIHITKNIPVAAGLAGGSSDCATVLKMLNKMFKVYASEEELMKLGETLGADVPYCIKGGTALCEGIGEKITAIKPFRNKIVLLVKPPFGVSTKDVYKAFDLGKVKIHPDTVNLIKKIEEDNLYYVASNMKNLLENVTIRKHKVLYKLKENGWDFYNLNSLQLPEEYLEDLWQVQKSFDITFNMKIPSGIDEYYGKKFERDGKMIPGIRLMYDELMGKEVNWYQIITYKENELTPRQVSLQRQEEKRKAFESARQQEINSVLNQVREMNVENIGGRSI